MIRPREITLALISKLTLVKSAQTSNSFGLKNRFCSILIDPVRLLTCPIFGVFLISYNLIINFTIPLQDLNNTCKNPTQNTDITVIKVRE